jgi:crossover junction endodeoxyribonuclease RuvC
VKDLPLRVLGVDPGSLITGWGLLSGPATRPLVEDCGAIRLPRGQALAPRLALLHDELTRLIQRLEPDTAAVESPFHGKSPRAALQLAHARGVVLAALAQAGIEVAEYTPATVKQAITSNGRADKEQVRRMVVALLGQRLAEGPADLADALAVGLCHLQTGAFQRAVRRAESRDAGRAAGPRRRGRPGRKRGGPDVEGAP